MHRFYVPPAQLNVDAPELTGREAHHCVRVRRVKRDEPVVIFDGQGSELVAVVSGSDRGKVKLRVIERRRVPPPRHAVALAQALLPHRAMDLVLGKATELGASRVVPVLTQRSVGQVRADEAAAKAARWRELVIESAKQCGAAWLPVVEPAVPIADFLRRESGADLKFIAVLDENARHPRSVFNSLAARRGRATSSARVVIGPEGGFTDEELGAAAESGFVPISLGGLTLRSETAAIYALSVLSHEFQWLDTSDATLGQSGA